MCFYESITNHETTDLTMKYTVNKGFIQYHFTKLFFYRNYNMKNDKFNEIFSSFDNASNSEFQNNFLRAKLKKNGCFLNQETTDQTSHII